MHILCLQLVLGSSVIDLEIACETAEDCGEVPKDELVFHSCMDNNCYRIFPHPLPVDPKPIIIDSKDEEQCDNCEE